jgi:hypothetical protein
MLCRPLCKKGVASEAVQGPTTLVADSTVQRLVLSRPGHENCRRDGQRAGPEQELVNVACLRWRSGRLD